MPEPDASKTIPAEQCRKSLMNHTRKEMECDNQRRMARTRAITMTHNTREAPLKTTSDRSGDMAEKNATGRPDCERHGSGKNPKKSQVRLFGFVRCQHPKLLPAGIVAAFVPRRTAQRAGIIPFRNANGGFLSQRGCAVNTCVTPTELCPYDFQRCSASVRKLNTNNRASTRDRQAGIQGGQVTMLENIKLAKLFSDFLFYTAEISFKAQQEIKFF